MRPLQVSSALFILLILFLVLMGLAGYLFTHGRKGHYEVYYVAGHCCFRCSCSLTSEGFNG